MGGGGGEGKGRGEVGEGRGGIQVCMSEEVTFGK